MKFLFVMLFVLTSCSSVSQKLDPSRFYKRDMEITINGLKAEGALVVPKAQSYKFNIKSQGRLDLFTFTTCHREQTKEKAGERGWFADKKRRKFEFFPVPIEANPLACPVELGGYEQKKGRHSWGFIDFEHPDLTLTAELSCNGDKRKVKGVSVCQAKKGLIQEIVFAQPVIVAEKNVCIILKSKDDKTFRFKMPKGRCLFRFLTKTGDKKWHRLTTLGYEKILVRED